MADWTQYVHPTLAGRLEAHTLVDAFYRGEGAERYLVQYKQGESQTQFEERVALAAFRPLLGEAIDAVAGVLMQALPRVERSWGSLGSEETPGTAAYRLERSIDAQGQDFDVLSLEAAVHLLLYNEVWALVDGPSTDPHGHEIDGRVTLLSPLSVPNWTESSHGLEEVLIKEQVLSGSSLFEEPELVDQYLLVSPAGWSRWASREGKPVSVASGLYSEDGRTFVSRSGLSVPPVVRVRLPFRRHVAAQLAGLARTIYNLESDRDALLRAASHPKLQLTASESEARSIVRGLRRGSNTLVSNPEHARGHGYIAPSTDGAEELRVVLDQKTKAFRQAAWRLYDAEARIATATEAMLQRSEGAGAILTVLATAVEELESSVLHFLEQAYGDGNGGRGWTSFSEWPRSGFDNLVPEDLSQRRHLSPTP